MHVLPRLFFKVGPAKPAAAAATTDRMLLVSLAVFDRVLGAVEEGGIPGQTVRDAGCAEGAGTPFELLVDRSVLRVSRTWRPFP